MARTIRTKVYKFEELSKDAQQKAIDNNIYINVDDDWWQSVYEDANEIGIKITGFDIGRGSFCEGEFNLAANEIAANIFRDHGEVCETYKTAQKFMEQWQPVFDNYMKNEEGEDKLMEIEDEFKKSILEDYRIMLTEEYEYQTSEEAIKETIIANEYEFTKDGNRF